MPLKRLLIAVWFCLVAAVALPAQQGGAAAGAPVEQHGEGHHEGGSPKLTREMSPADVMKRQFTHSVPYPVAFFEKDEHGKPKEVSWLTVYNVQPWQWVCIGLMFVVFLPVLGSFKTGRASRFTRVMRGFCLWVRDEMVYSVMGKEEGKAFVPLFFFMFFFIVFQNVIGLIPSAGHHFPLAIYTATGTPNVTAPLALITLALMLGFGFKKNGVFGFFKGLIPHGLPLPLVLLLAPIELVGLLVKPFALTVRLFANMLSGHLVIAAAIGLIFVFAKMQAGPDGESWVSYVTALPCFGMAVFIYIIEAFITLLQAYIFTFLSINFIYQSIHQDH